MNAFLEGFLSELEKSAEEKKKSRGSFGKKLLTHMGISVAGSAASGAAVMGAVAGSKPMQAEDVSALKRLSKPHARLNMTGAPSFAANMVPSHGALPWARETARPQLNIPQRASLEIGLHELGHAKGEFGRHGLGNVMRKVHQYGNLASMAAAPAALYGAYKAYTDPESTTAKLAPAAAALASGKLHRIPGEAIASAYAIKDLYKLKGGMAALKGGARLTSALGSYALAAAVPALGMEAVRRMGLRKETKA